MCYLYQLLHLGWYIWHMHSPLWYIAIIHIFTCMILLLPPPPPPGQIPSPRIIIVWGFHLHLRPTCWFLIDERSQGSIASARPPSLSPLGRERRYQTCLNFQAEHVSQSVLAPARKTHSNPIGFRCSQWYFMVVSVYCRNSIHLVLKLITKSDSIDNSI